MAFESKQINGEQYSGKTKILNLDESIPQGKNVVATRTEFEQIEQAQKEKQNKLMVDKSKVKQADKVLSGKGQFRKEKVNVEDVDRPVIFEEVMAAPVVDLVSVEQIKQIYPVKVSDKVLENVTCMINEAITECPEGLGEYLKSTLIGTLDVLRSNKTNSINDFISASKFITYKSMGDSNLRAYCKTFPDRVKRLEVEGKNMDFLHAYASSYSRNTLVTKMQSLMIAPIHVLYQDDFHRAIQIQSEIMQDTKVSPKVRVDAANSLLTHLKPETVKQAEVKVALQESNLLEQFKGAMAQMAAISRAKIIEGECKIADVSSIRIYDEELDNRAEN